MNSHGTLEEKAERKESDVDGGSTTEVDRTAAQVLASGVNGSPKLSTNIRKLPSLESSSFGKGGGGFVPIVSASKLAKKWSARVFGEEPEFELTGDRERRDNLQSRGRRRMHSLPNDDQLAKLLFYGASGKENEIDTDLSFNELSNALREAFLRIMEKARLNESVRSVAPAGYHKSLKWVTRLHDIFSLMAAQRVNDEKIDLEEFGGALTKMFSVEFRPEVVNQLFHSLDSSRQGFITWEQFYHYFSPHSGSDVLEKSCGNVVTCVAYNDTVSRIAFGTNDGRVEVISTEEGEEESEPLFQRLHASIVTVVLLSSDGTMLYVGRHKDEPFFIEYDIESKLDTRSFEYPSDVHCAALSSDNHLLALGGSALCVRLYDMSTAKVLAELSYPSNIEAVTLSRGSTYVLKLSRPIENQEYIEVDEEQFHVCVFDSDEPTKASAQPTRDSPSPTHHDPRKLYVDYSLSETFPIEYAYNKRIGINIDSLGTLDCTVVLFGVVLTPFDEKTQLITIEDDLKRTYRIDPSEADICPWPKSHQVAHGMPTGTRVMITLHGTILKHNKKKNVRPSPWVPR